MELKHFFAPDMRTAINLVKKELGPEAIIFSQRKVEGGIEIEAAIDKDANAPKKAFAQQQTVNKPPHYPHNQLNKMQQELQLLREMLENQMAGLVWQEQLRLKPETSWLMSKLKEMSFTADICKLVLDKLDNKLPLEKMWRQAQDILLDLIPRSELDLMNHGGIVALVGPTGVGKTTTIAKIAARYVLRHGADKVGLITTDFYRVAAREQLMVYGNILKVPVINATNVEQLSDALKSLAHKELVLIDTAGISQREIQLTDKLALLSQSYASSFHVCLVLSATSQSNVLDEVVKAFKHLPLKECILTKLDEAVTVGSTLSALIHHHIPAAYMTTGQRVPEDLQPANPVFLMNKALESLSTEQVDIPNKELAFEFAGGKLDGYN